MLPKKVEITNNLCTIIYNKRTDVNISGKELSKKLGRSISYISLLENGRIKYLKRNEIIKIFQILYKIDEETAEQNIEKILLISSKENNTSIPNDNNVDADIDTTIADKTIDKPFQADNVKDYSILGNSRSNEMVTKCFRNIESGFEVAYDKWPEKTISILRNLVASMHFDLGFMLAIFSTPFFALEGLSHDERQQFLNEVSDIFKKYTVVSKKHLDQQKEDEADVSEGSSANPDPDDLQAADTSSDDSD